MTDPLAPCGYCRRCAIHDDPGGCLTVEHYVRDTILGHLHSNTRDQYACGVCGGRTYEVQSDRGTWLRTSQWMFRSWSGPRRLDGLTFDGPVYILGNAEVYTGVMA